MALAGWRARIPTRPFTRGETTVGKTADALIANQKPVNACAVFVNATLTELVVYLAPTSRFRTEVMSEVFHADSKGKPGALLGTTENSRSRAKKRAAGRAAVCAPR